MKFPSDFVFGAGTSAYQIEGAWNEDGRTPSIWDNIAHDYPQIKGDGDVACDHYHRWEEDIRLMKELKLEAYRLSISWNRIVPAIDGRVNEKGVAFYNNLIDALLESGITPYVTIYHFDLPQYLQDQGGWLNRSTINAFEHYAKVCFSNFGDRVKHWITINEPYIVANMYAAAAKYVPDMGRPIDLALKASHYLNVAHCKASEAYDQSPYNDGKIGIAPNLSTIYGDLPTATLGFADALYNRFYMEYAFKGEYPVEVMDFVRDHGISIDLTPEDLVLFRKTRTDFVGINNYSRMTLSPDIDFLSFSSETMAMTTIGKDGEGKRYNEYGWEIYPKGIYEIINHVSELYDYPEIIITENGTACKDDVTLNGMVQDDDRIEYMEEYLEQVVIAIQEGARVSGYFVWSLMDNFEWTSAYSIKMGLVKVDFETLERTVKKSGFWFKALIEEHKEA